MEENEIKIEAKNFGEPYLTEYKGEKVVLYKSKYDGMLYAQCPGCGHTTYFYISHENEPNAMIALSTLVTFLEHKHTCPGTKSLNNLDELFEEVSQYKVLEVVLVKEIVKALYSVADAINNLNE